MTTTPLPRKDDLLTALRECVAQVERRRDVVSAGVCMDFIAEHGAALLAAVEDAGRYRWLRDESQPNNPHTTFYLSVGEVFKDVPFKSEVVDASIDAALKGER